jgi:hypothetical protein
MGSKADAGHARWFSAALGFLTLLGLLLLVEGPVRIAAHDYSMPSYHDHNHHLCHALTEALAVLSLCWATLLVLLARTRDAITADWGRRLLGLPVALLAVLGVVMGECRLWCVCLFVCLFAPVCVCM